MIYISILVLKIIENTLATLRMIITTNGQKGLGAFLNLIIALVWIISTAMVIINIQEDLLKIVAFIVGSYIGSYVGCIIEEKLAIGSNIIICIPSKEGSLVEKLKDLEYEVFISGEMLIIMTSRKKKRMATSMIKRLDKNATVIISSAYLYNK